MKKRFGAIRLTRIAPYDTPDAEKLRLQLRLAVFQEHAGDLLEIAIELIQGFALGMGTREPGHKTDEQVGLWAAFNDSGVGSQGVLRLGDEDLSAQQG